MPKRGKTDFFAVGSGVLSGAKRVKTTVNVGGRSVSASVPLGWSGGQLRKHKRGPKLSPEARQARARLRSMDRSDIRFEAISRALFAKSLKKVRLLGYWHNFGPNGRSAWRLGGWWSVRACKKCGEARYVLPKVGFITVHFRPDRTKFVTRRPWPTAGVSSLLWGRFSPHEDSRPAVGCQCITEP